MIELLNTRDIARMYHVTSATVLNWIRAGKLKAYTTPGGHYRIARDDLDAFSRNFGPPPEVGISSFGMRLLLVGVDISLYERLRDAIRFRWPAAQLERADTEFEVGWWLARLRPTHILVHPSMTPALLDRCRELASISNLGDGPRFTPLPEMPEDGLSEWIEREFGRA